MLDILIFDIDGIFMPATVVHCINMLFENIFFNFYHYIIKIIEKHKKNFNLIFFSK
jgi:hypothetical protein